MARALMATTAATAVAVPVLVLLSLAQGAGSRSVETWRAHHEACHQIPEEVYHRDRFRAIRGRVTDADGLPVAGALVRCVCLENLVEMAKAGPPAPMKWSVPIEAETRTDDLGRYEFPHLSVGGRTFFYSPPSGRDLAPAIKDLMVVQDGLGAQLDVTLARPSKLLVRLRTSVKEWTRLYLIPQRWWPSLEVTTMPPRWRAAEFQRLGGPFRKGLIAIGGPDESSPPRIIGRYDLDRSTEVELSGREVPVTRYDLPEAAGLEPWRFEPSTEERLFYAAMSPVPLFWRESATGWPSWLPQPAFLQKLATRSGSGDGSRIPPRAHDAAVGAGSVRRPSASPAEAADHGSRSQAVPRPSAPLPARLASAPPPLKSNESATGVVRGFAPHPFLPVLVESHTSAPRLAWTSDASEFDVDGLSAASYRVRALDLFGRVTFAAGVSVRPDRMAGPDEHVRLWSKVELDEPDSRQVMGFVKWESGLPVAKAVVFMQCSYNFRRYVRRVETDDHGFFRFFDVPGNEPYFIFALPPGTDDAMRNFEYFGVGSLQREVWRELNLHPHRVTGTLGGLGARVATAASSLHPAGEGMPDGRVGGRSASLQLVRVGGEAEPAIWTFRAGPSGRFTLSNVPHGRYCVQMTQIDGEPLLRSLPFDVGDGRPAITVRWSS